MSDKKNSSTSDTSTSNGTPATESYHNIHGSTDFGESINRGLDVRNSMPAPSNPNRGNDRGGDNKSDQGGS